jgi:outer membrane lipoprotein-sorting protein
MRLSSMKRKQAVVLATITLLSVGGVVVGRAQVHSGGGSAVDGSAGPKKAEEQFKNIQVLKGIPADQVVPGMQFIATSLGVECQFCHVEGAFEKDDKKTKQTARKMMAMMFAINKENFDGHLNVTCYSCHHGNSKPVGIPPVMAEEPKAGVGEAKVVEANKGEGLDAKEANAPTADQLIEKYVQALGGATATDKITSRVMKGTITFGDRNIPIDIYSKDPDKRISFTHTPDGDSVTAFDGHEGWLGFPGRAAREMHGSELDAAGMDADLHFAAHLKGMFKEAQVHGMEKVDDHDVYLVIGQREGRTPLRLYFDEKSGLLVRLVRYGDTPFGLMPTQIDYADYREAGGVKMPFRWTLARPSGRFTIQVSDVRQNAPVDDAKFAKPAAPAEGQKGPAK